jgi:hypothetical protein
MATTTADLQEGSKGTTTRAGDALISEDLAVVRPDIVPPEDTVVLVGVSQERRTHVQQRAHAEARLLRQMQNPDE